MKRHIILICTTLLAISGFSQPSPYYTDGIRLSEDFYGASARTSAMSGAFGALGGDLGSVPINPAGLGVYRSGEFSFTPGFESSNTTSKYLNMSTPDQNHQFTMGNIGWLSSFKTNDPDGWSNFSFSFGYNKLNDFNSSYDIQGTTDGTTSLTNEFLSNANGTYPEDLNSYYERLAFDGYVIDTVKGADGKTYNSPFTGIPLNQRQTINKSGYSGEYYFGFGTNYGNKLYLGATINIKYTTYNEDYSLTEKDATGAAGYNSYEFDNSLRTSGTGVNLKLGAIYKPVEFLRVGFAIHTPFRMNVTQEFNSQLYSTYGSGPVNPTDINGYLIGSSSYNFSTLSPFRAVGSLALVYPALGLLSFDYEYVDYRSLNISSNDLTSDDIQTFNNGTNKYFQSTSNIRIGAEVRMGSAYLRGGYALYQSPYSSSENGINKEGNTMIYSGGVGYRENNFYIDFAYSLQSNSQDYYLYNDPNLTAATLITNTSKFISTIGFRF
jgi:hypothetical protein